MTLDNVASKIVQMGKIWFSLDVFSPFLEYLDILSLSDDFHSKEVMDK